MKYYIKTFGCQMNKSDSERIATILQKTNYRPTPKIEGANLVVVNMCSVRQSAVDRVYGLALRIEKLKKERSIQSILTGCILKKDKKNLSKKFDLLLDIKSLPKWPQILKSKEMISGKDLINTTNYLKIKPSYTNGFSANIPIMTGCNNFCAYCVVPYTRGREISRPAKEITCEIKNLIKRGYKEIWLLGQNVNSYNNKQRIINNKRKINFPKLLRKINGIPGDFWIRFTSSHPKDFSNDLIKAIKECEKVTEYLNLPAQSGDDGILKRMNRLYNIKEYKNLIKKIRKEVSEITISTDIIVGFPGETKEQFNNTAKLFKEIKYDMAYISKYSPRSQTAASKLEDNVSQKEKNRREKVLTDILKETALKKNKKYIGKEIRVLINRKRDSNTWIGKSKKYKTIKVNSAKNLLGKFIKVKITDALPWGLKGKLIT